MTFVLGLWFSTSGQEKKDTDLEHPDRADGHVCQHLLDVGSPHPSNQHHLSFERRVITASLLLFAHTQQALRLPNTIACT